jgi:hypothetical protein
LHSANLRRGTDGVTPPPPPRRKVFRPKNPTASARFEPTNLGTLLICALLFTVFYIACTVYFVVLFGLCIFILIVLSVLV